MRLVNKTHWRTDHLKAILQKAAVVELEPAKRRKLVVEVTYTGTRGRGSSGCAFVGGNWARVRIPKGAKEPSPAWIDALNNPTLNAASKKSIADHLKSFTPEKASAELRYNLMAFASVACHEFAHCRGMQHAQMPTYYTWAGAWKEYVSWAQDMPLDVAPSKVTKTLTPAERASDKLAHVLKMETRAKTRAKKATTILKKWQAKRKYYERRVAALASM